MQQRFWHVMCDMLMRHSSGHMKKGGNTVTWISTSRFMRLMALLKGTCLSKSARWCDLTSNLSVMSLDFKHWIHCSMPCYGASYMNMDLK